MIKSLDAPSCTLGENPLWRADTYEFYWTDIVKGTIYAWNPSDDKPAYSVLNTTFQIGAFLFTKSYDLLLFTEKGVFLAVQNKNGYGSELKLLWSVSFTEGERFNDAICGPDGRLMAGSKREDNSDGSLYCFEMNKKPKILLEHLSISNGMGFSPDGTVFYHTDSGFGTITAYHYGQRGLAEPIGVLYQSPDLNAVPDGMTVDYQGNIWTALWGGHTILQISPQGLPLKQIHLHASQVSSVCFGDTHLDKLLVTSASIGSVDDSDCDSEGNYLGGNTYLLLDVGYGTEEYTIDI